MLIWLIQIGEPLPFDENVNKMRTTLLADRLIERGHSIIWWTSAYNHFLKDWIFEKDTEFTIKEGLKIVAMKGSGYKKNISFSRFRDHRIIAKKFRKLAPETHKPDIIVTSTPPYDLAYEAVMFSKMNKIPVLVDIRDEWPDLFINITPKRFRKFMKILLANDFQMIKEIMRTADGLIAMMDSLLVWGLKYAKRSKTLKDSVFYLGSKKNAYNYNKEKNFKCFNFINDKFVITFIGTFVKNNNPSILVDCAEKLADENIHFVMAGDGELFNEIKKKSIGLPNILMPGWLNQAEISNLMQNSHVGVCLTTQVRDALPNKTFTYLSAGLPIISAFQGDSKKIIEKYQIGFYYPPNDMDALLDCINKLHSDQYLYKKMSENARKVFNEMFDADKIYEEYAVHIEKVVGNYNRSAS